MLQTRLKREIKMKEGKTIRKREIYKNNERGEE
jgi:hypothetical protein